MREAKSEWPIPDLESQPITEEQYFAFTPEKFELCKGYLFEPPDRHELRTPLLALLLRNEGLLRAVRLAPLERWREALRRAGARSKVFRPVELGLDRGS